MTDTENATETTSPAPIAPVYDPVPAAATVLPSEVEGAPPGFFDPAIDAPAPADVADEPQEPPKKASEPLFNRVPSGALDNPTEIKHGERGTVLVVGDMKVHYLSLDDEFSLGDMVAIYADGGGAHNVKISLPEGHMIFGVPDNTLVIKTGAIMHKISDTEWGVVVS